MFSALLTLLVVCLSCGCERQRASPVSVLPGKENSVAAFLGNAERQSETNEQRKEIQRALRDMLDKPSAELRQMHYPDYAGQANAWSIIQLLQHYFVPNPPVSLDEQRFFQDVDAPAARVAIKYQLDEVTRAIQ